MNNNPLECDGEVHTHVRAGDPLMRVLPAIVLGVLAVGYLVTRVASTRGHRPAHPSDLCPSARKPNPLRERCSPRPMAWHRASVRAARCTERCRGACGTGSGRTVRRRRAATRGTVIWLRLAGFEVPIRHCRPTTPTQITQIRHASPDDTEKRPANAERRMGRTPSIRYGQDSRDRTRHRSGWT